jgi:hypothetical protein
MIIHFASPWNMECLALTLRVLHIPVPNLYSTARLMFLEEHATQCQFDLGVVFQLPQSLQKYATNACVPQEHFAGRNRPIDTIFLHRRQDQRNRGIRSQKITRPVKATADDTIDAAEYPGGLRPRRLTRQ